MGNFNRQQGGTLIGLVIGLVIGLAIALGVAVMITKAPVPFMNKVVKQGADPAAGQISDPNKPLYGNKTAIREAAKAFAKERESNEPAPQSAGVAPETKPDSKPAIVELSNIDRAKKAEVVTASVKPNSADSSAADDKWAYYLQAGAFRDSVDAENVRAKLALMGVEARITERQAESGLLYRVRVGPFGQIDAMNRIRGKLADNGIDAAIVRVAKN